MRRSVKGKPLCPEPCVVSAETVWSAASALLGFAEVRGRSVWPWLPLTGAENAVDGGGGCATSPRSQRLSYHFQHACFRWHHPPEEPAVLNCEITVNLLSGLCNPGSEHCVQTDQITASVYHNLQIKTDLTLQIETNPTRTNTHKYTNTQESRR